VSGNRRRIAVVGAGCAGAVAAWRLAQAGLAPVLLDKDPTPGVSAACGGVMLHALYRRLELPPDLIDGEVTSLRLFEGGRCDRLEFRRPVFINFDRCRFDAFLAERAVGAGARLHSGCRVVGWDPASGELRWRRNGADEREPFDQVVFADGFSSVARSAGIGIDGDTPMASAIYRELQNDEERSHEVDFMLDLEDEDPGYFWVFPKRGLVQVGVGRFHGERREPLRRLLDRFIAERAELKSLPCSRTRGGGIPFAVARRLGRPGGLVVGDAAGLVNPVTGGGLVYAAASAEMAARAIVEGASRGRDRSWAAARYRRLMVRSVHYWWLTSLGLVFRRIRRQVALGRRTDFKRLFLIYAVILPRLTPAAGSITLAMREPRPAVLSRRV
jgi:geranylgeranyl reductase family protein